MSRLEKDIENEFVELVNATEGWATEKYEFKGKRGALDRIVFMKKGICCFIEFKRTANDKPSPHQIKEAYRMRSLGFKCHLAHDAEDAYKFCLSVQRGNTYEPS